MSAVGLAATALVESPRDLAARSAAPPPAVLTAVARWHVLADIITVAGVVRSARTISVTASAPFTVVAVTKMAVRVGDRVWPGHVIAEIDGRPIVLLHGRLPAYRDLREGDVGPDVAQLQEALERLGYADFDPAGVFGPSTALALLLLYQHLGYRAPLLGSAGAGRRPARVPDAYLPMSEVVYIPGRSALVVSVLARVGTVVARGPVLRLATGRPYVTAELAAFQAALMRAGMPVTISAASPKLAAPGVLTRIGELPSGQGFAGPGAGGSATTRYPIDAATRRPLPQRLIGTAVEVTVSVPVTARPVLSVPLAAIFGPARHLPAYVVKIARNGRRTRVAVRTGPTADGLVAVQSVRAGALRPGDRVLIGIGPAR